MNEIVRLDRSSCHPGRQEAAPSQSEVERAFREVFRRMGEFTTVLGNKPSQASTRLL